MSNYSIKNASTRDRAMSLPAALRFNQEISRYSHMKQYDSAVLCFKRMLESNVSPDIVTFNIMINVYVKMQRIKDAFKLYHKMRSEGIDPTIVTYTSLIDGCGKCGQFGLAMSLYNEGGKSEVNMHFFNAIMNAGLLNGYLHIIDDVWVEIQKRNLRPNTVTFNTLLSGYFRFNQLDKMLSVMRKMLELKVEISLITQTTILQSVQLVRTDMDLSLFLELLDIANLIPSQTQGSQAVLDLISLKRVNMAQKLTITLISMNCGLTEDVFIQLALLAGETGNFPVLQWLYKSSVEYGYNITQYLYFANIHAFSKYDNEIEVKHLCSHVNIDYQMIPFNVKMGIFQCSFNNGEIKYGLDILEQCIESKQIDFQSLDKIFESLFSRDLFDYIVKIFNTQLKFQFLSFGQISSDCIISSFAFTKTHLNTFNCFKPSIRSLIHLAKSIEIDEIESSNWECLIKSVAFVPPPNLFLEFMNALYLKKQLRGVWISYKHFISLGATPSNNMYEMIMIYFKENGTIEDYLFVLNTAPELPSDISSSLYSVMISKSLEDGNLSEALRLHNEAKALNITISKKIEEEFNEKFNNVHDALPAVPKLIMFPRVNNTRGRSLTCPKKEKFSGFV